MNYWDYINVEGLLSLQTGLRQEGEPDDDEVLFIVVHQIYELWFKLLLRELRSVRHIFRQDPVPDEACARAVRSLRRCVTIFEVAARHWSVVETLSTRDYLAFRDRLVGASGFQSAQVRQLEILLGLDDERRIPCAGEKSYLEVLRHPDGSRSNALDRVEEELNGGPSYRHALYRWLARTPIDGSSSPESVDTFVESFLKAHEKQANFLLEQSRKAVARDVDPDVLKTRYEQDMARARAFMEARDVEGLDEQKRRERMHLRAALVFIESHRELPRLSWPREVIDTTIALEQAMVVWRQRHARMVEKMIGRRPGTGGSGGVAYLDQTALKYRIFTDLWEVRTVLLRRELVPPLRNPDAYKLRVQD